MAVPLVFLAAHISDLYNQKRHCSLLKGQPDADKKKKFYHGDRGLGGYCRAPTVRSRTLRRTLTILALACPKVDPLELTVGDEVYTSIRYEATALPLDEEGTPDQVTMRALGPAAAASTIPGAWCRA